jgi:peptide/nickel transport system substrate-binding protein
VPATQAPSSSGGASNAPASSSPGPKRIVAAISGEPNTFNNTVARAGAGGVAGVDALEQFVSAGLTQLDDTGVQRAQLAEAVPSVDNGLWKVNADGTMETTWRIKPGATWHDGTPLMADDLLFTVQVGEDKEIPALSNSAYNSIESVTAPDPSTVTVHWKKPFIQADTMFSYDLALPLPKHLLEKAFEDDKAGFTQVPYWTTAFVGAGPFRVKEFSLGSFIILSANDAYVLGRPKVDEVEIRFMRDPNALIASILSGNVELTMGRGLSLEQAVQVRDNWQGGKLGVVLSSWIAAYPQMLNPTPAAIADARFRQALLTAVDRQQMVDSLQAGQSMVAHSYLSPKEAQYSTVEQGIVRYDYDTRRAMTLMESVGYVRGADGLLRDAAGQPLTMEVRTTGGDDLQEKTLFSMADNWQRLGVTVDPVVVPPQRAQDREYRANFPALEEVRQPNDLTTGSLTRYYGPESSLPENNYRGSNRMRYSSVELNGLIDRFYTTIPQGERGQVLSGIIHHMTDQVIPLGMFYNAQPAMIGNRLVNVGPGGATTATPAWNSAQWDVK